MALAPLPGSRFRFDVRRARFADDDAPLVEGCRCATCGAHSRAYVHYLSRAEEMTGVRLLTLHNLAYLERLVHGAREAIRAGGLAAYRERTLAGVPPWTALTVACAS
jgi:queuine tRNA-ribosyltransferase